MEENKKKYLVLHILVGFIISCQTTSTSLKNNQKLKLDIEVLGYPKNIQKIFTNDKPLYDEYANFDIKLISNKNDKYWIECYPYEGTYTSGYLTNGQANVVSQEIRKVGAIFGCPCKVIKWICNVRENST
jgi:hypothetical protein